MVGFNDSIELCTTCGNISVNSIFCFSTNIFCPCRYFYCSSYISIVLGRKVQRWHTTVGTISKFLRTTAIPGGMVRVSNPSPFPLPVIERFRTQGGRSAHVARKRSLGLPQHSKSDIFDDKSPRPFRPVLSDTRYHVSNRKHTR